MRTKSLVASPFVLLAVAALAVGVACLVASFLSMPIVVTPELTLLLVAALLYENFAFSLPSFSVSLSYPLTIGAIILGGPAAAGVVAAVSSTNYGEFRAHRPISVIAYNLGQLVTITSFGAWTYFALDGRVLLTGASQYMPLGVADFPRILVPMIATATVCALGNLLLTAIGVAVLQTRTFRELALAMAPFVPTQIALAFVGYLIAQVLAISLVGLPLFVFPLMVARQLYQRYSGLREAYADTVRSLVGALEAKDPYTRGHSERVAKYAVAIGNRMQMDPRIIDQIERAALLHDLGKLAIPRTLLVKPGKLSHSEMLTIREHPDVGARMIERVPHLRELAGFVRYHHERFDGAGYPCGVSGSGIPAVARVLAVADSYDAMTSTRAYRPAMNADRAMQELVSGSGSQFDPAVVNAFMRIETGEGATAEGELSSAQYLREAEVGAQG